MVTKKAPEGDEDKRDEGAAAHSESGQDKSAQIDTNDPTLSPTEAVEQALSAQADD